MSLDGILYYVIQHGSHTRESFISFIDGLLDFMNPFPLPNSVLVIDNASIHKSSIIREMVEARCEAFLFLSNHDLTNSSLL